MQSYGKDVRLVFKHLPLEGHRNSLPAARAAYCAAEQDRFWQFHDALFASRNLSPAVFDEIATDLGLGLPKFQACLNSEHSRSCDRQRTSKRRGCFASRALPASSSMAS